MAEQQQLQAAAGRRHWQKRSCWVSVTPKSPRLGETRRRSSPHLHGEVPPSQPPVLFSPQVRYGTHPPAGINLMTDKYGWNGREQAQSSSRSPRSGVIHGVGRALWCPTAFSTPGPFLATLKSSASDIVAFYLYVTPHLGFLTYISVPLKSFHAATMRR